MPNEFLQQCLRSKGQRTSRDDRSRTDHHIVQCRITFHSQRRLSPADEPGSQEISAQIDHALTAVRRGHAQPIDHIDGRTRHGVQRACIGDAVQRAVLEQQASAVGQYRAADEQPRKPIDSCRIGLGEIEDRTGVVQRAVKAQRDDAPTVDHSAKGTRHTGESVASHATNEALFSSEMVPVLVKRVCDVEFKIP